MRVVVPGLVKARATRVRTRSGSRLNGTLLFGRGSGGGESIGRRGGVGRVSQLDRSGVEPAA